MLIIFTLLWICSLLFLRLPYYASLHPRLPQRHVTKILQKGLLLSKNLFRLLYFFGLMSLLGWQFRQLSSHYIWWPSVWSFWEILALMLLALLACFHSQALFLQLLGMWQRHRQRYILAPIKASVRLKQLPAPMLYFLALSQQLFFNQIFLTQLALVLPLALALIINALLFSLVSILDKGWAASLCFGSFIFCFVHALLHLLQMGAIVPMLNYAIYLFFIRKISVRKS